DVIFARALDKDGSRRYPSASAFVAALEMKEIEVVLGSPPTLTPSPALSSEGLGPQDPMPTVDLRAEEAARTLPAAPDAVKQLAPPKRSYRLHAVAGPPPLLSLPLPAP